MCLGVVHRMWKSGWLCVVSSHLLPSYGFWGLNSVYPLSHLARTNFHFNTNFHQDNVNFIKISWGLMCSSVVEYMPGVSQSLGYIPNTMKK